MPILGESFWPYLSGEKSAVHEAADVAGWSANGAGAIIRGNYKLINEGPPGGTGEEMPWRLYDISVDPGETNDIAMDHPELTAELIEEWETNWR